MFELIKKEEGLRLKPYLCSAGVPTIGWGTTVYPNGIKVSLKDKPITRDEADHLLEWYCDTQIKLPKGDFTYHQKEALYSLIYNIGQTAFDKSKCKKAIESKDWVTAEKEWNWSYSCGKISKALAGRRKREKELFFNFRKEDSNVCW